MTTTDTISDLLALDPSDPEQAVRLRIGIFQLLGVKVIRGEYQDRLTLGYPMRTGYKMVLPEPNSGYDLGWWQTEDKAWAEGMRYAGIPDYVRSIDAALTLPLPDDKYQPRIGMFHQDGKVMWEAWFVDDYSGQWNEVSEIPAVAYCRAWLHYKQAELAPRKNGDEG